MNTKKIIASIVSFATGASLMLGFSVTLVHAETLNTSASTTVTVSAKKQADQAARLSKIIAASDTTITARIAALNQLATRVQELKNVSDAEKTSISTAVQTNISGLTALKTKIDADTDLTVATTDNKAIFDSYRTYALIIPQGHFEASADRVITIVGMMTTISAKLQTRITADQSAGKNVTALQASLTDLNAKIADAKIQAIAAQTGVATLTPDQGDKTKLASNTAALKAARATLKIASQDLQTADQDAKSIIRGLKALDGKTSTSTNMVASTTATH